MKKVLFVSICLLLASAAVFAQQGQRVQRTPEENAKRQTERMTTDLKLTPEQVAPIDSINLVFAQARAKLVEKANGDIASVRDDMQKLTALQVEAYGKVLTADQLAAYKKQTEDRRQRGQGGQGGGQGRRGGGGGNNQN